MMYAREPGTGGGPEQFETPRLEDLAAEAVDLYEMVTEVQMSHNATELNFPIVHTGINAAFFEDNEEHRAAAAERFLLLESVLPCVPLSTDILGMVYRNFELAADYGGDLAATAERILAAIPQDRQDLRAELDARLSPVSDGAMASRVVDRIWHAPMPVSKKIGLYHELDLHDHIDVSQRILGLSDMIRDPLEASQAAINYGRLSANHVRPGYIECAIDHIDKVVWAQLDYADSSSELIRFDDRSAYIVQLAGLYRLTANEKYKEAVASAIDRMPEDDRLALNYKTQVISRVADMYPHAPEEVRRLGEDESLGMSNVTLQHLAEAYARQRDLFSADYYADRITTMSVLHDTRRRMVEVGRWTPVFSKLLSSLDSSPFLDSRLNATASVLINATMYGEAYALQERIRSLTSRSLVIANIGRTMTGKIPRTQDVY